VSLCRVDSDGDSYLVVVASEAAATDRVAVEQSPPVPCDPLTGLPGRMELQRQLDRRLNQAEQADGRFAVLFIDIDGFKQVNDTLGHLAGDQVLKQVAERLTSCLRPTDAAVRFGGDEFVAVVANIRCVDDVIRVAERIRQTMSEAIDVGGQSVAVSASIGIAMAANAQQGATQLIDSADQAMYRAKARGRHGFYEVSCDRVDCGYSAAWPDANDMALNIIPLSSAAPRAPHRLPR